MDFYQGMITTLHAITPDHDRVVLERVREAVQKRPASLVVPMVYSELEKPAMKGIVNELSKCDFLQSTIVALTAEDEQEFSKAVKFFDDHDVNANILWCEHPEVREQLMGLKDQGLELAEFTGKGIAVWTAFGIASLNSHAIALHDADVENYSNNIVSRLLLPIVRREMDFFYSKGYYARVTDERLYGRVVRLFVWPLLDALQVHQEHRSDVIRYLRGFRYPLAGEFAIASDLALNVRVPTDWGLEVGLLGEVYRNASLKRICQVDLGLYSHKHKKLGTSVNEGLLKMTHDIVITLLRLMTELEGREFSESTLLGLRVLYRRLAQDYIRKYAVDSKVNGLQYDRHGEEQMIDAFAWVIEQAGRSYLQNPGREQVPDWLRVISASPDLPARIQDTTRPTQRQLKRLEDAVVESNQL